jgi:hypothetical protein
MSRDLLALARDSPETCRDGCCANSISLREFVAALVVVAAAEAAVAVAA